MDQVWVEHRQRLRNVVLSMVPDPGCVDDLLQEALLKALGAQRKFESPQDALRYLHRVVINTTIDHYRKTSKRRRHFQIPLDKDGNLESRKNFYPGSKVVAHPLARLLSRERQRLREGLLFEVEQALASIPKPQREAIRLIFGDRDRPLKEICAERGLPYSTLRSRMLRGVDRIRDHLKDRGFYPHEDSPEV